MVRGTPYRCPDREIAPPCVHRGVDAWIPSPRRTPAAAGTRCGRTAGGGQGPRHGIGATGRVRGRTRLRGRRGAVRRIVPSRRSLRFGSATGKCREPGSCRPESWPSAWSRPCGWAGELHRRLGLARTRLAEACVRHLGDRCQLARAGVGFAVHHATRAEDQPPSGRAVQATQQPMKLSSVCSRRRSSRLGEGRGPRGAKAVREPTLHARHAGRERTRGAHRRAASSAGGGRSGQVLVGGPGGEDAQPFVGGGAGHRGPDGQVLVGVGVGGEGVPVQD